MMGRLIARRRQARALTPSTTESVVLDVDVRDLGRVLEPYAGNAESARSWLELVASA
jgi:hypothetical protein